MIACNLGRAIMNNNKNSGISVWVNFHTVAEPSEVLPVTDNTFFSTTVEASVTIAIVYNKSQQPISSFRNPWGKGQRFIHSNVKT